MFKGVTAERIWERDRGLCQLGYEGCKTHADQIDHIEPWFLGGGEELENGQLVCTPCHQKKTAQESLLSRRMNQRKALHRSARLPHPFYR